MPIVVRFSDPIAEARRLMGNAARSANINAIVRLLQKSSATRSPPYYKVRNAARRVASTHRASLAKAIRANLARRRQKRAENFLLSSAGLGRSVLGPNEIRSVARYLTSVRRN